MCRLHTHAVAVHMDRVDEVILRGTNRRAGKIVEEGGHPLDRMGGTRGVAAEGR